MFKDRVSKNWNPGIEDSGYYFKNSTFIYKTFLENRLNKSFIIRKFFYQKQILDIGLLNPTIHEGLEWPL